MSAAGRVRVVGAAEGGLDQRDVPPAPGPLLGRAAAAPGQAVSVFSTVSCSRRSCSRRSTFRDSTAYCSRAAWSARSTAASAVAARRPAGTRRPPEVH